MAGFRGTEVTPSVFHRPQLTKLTATIVVEMRRQHREGEDTKALAYEYGVHYSTAARALNHETWKFV